MGLVQPQPWGPTASPFPAPPARLMSDIAISTLGSSQAVFCHLFVLIWVFSGMTLCPCLVWVQTVAMVWTRLHAAGLPGGVPGWGCSQSFPGRARLLRRASNPAASVVVAIQHPLAGSELGYGHTVCPLGPWGRDRAPSKPTLPRPLLWHAQGCWGVRVAHPPFWHEDPSPPCGQRAEQRLSLVSHPPVSRASQQGQDQAPLPPASAIKRCGHVW